MQIVIVDASRVVLRLLTDLLTDQGHRVTAFTDGDSALDHIRSDPSVDVLITSFEIPNKSGLELCWETRLIAQTRRPIYVIAMSSTAEKTKLIQALDSGADDFFSKPPIPEELRARIRAAQRLIEMQNQLIHLASRDPLTDLYNRRAFFEQAETILSTLEGMDGAIAIMFDIDRFKSINDQYGHDIGDAVIRAVADTCRTACQSHDQSHGMGAETALLGRLGGEEFAVLIPHMTEQAGAQFAEEMRQALCALALPTPSGSIGCTCSFGVSLWRSKDSLDQILKRADMALYHAKNNGRNQVVIFEEQPSRHKKTDNAP